MNKRTLTLLALLAALLVFTGICSAASNRWRDPITGIWYDDRDPNDRVMRPEDVMPPLDPTPVRFQVSGKEDGTYNMHMRIRNLSQMPWNTNLNCQLLCKKGLEMLPDGAPTSWSITKDTPRGLDYELDIPLKDYEFGKRMVFSIRCGNSYAGGFWIRL